MTLRRDDCMHLFHSVYDVQQGVLDLVGSGGYRS
jgi:hypothetical protein